MTLFAPLTRRQALSGMAAGLGSLAMGSPLQALTAGARHRPSHRRLVVLWLDGGPSQFETFDPKPGTKTGGPTQALATDIADWQFSQSLPGLAQRAEHLAVIRSMTTKEGNHERARQLIKTGYVPNPTVSYPPLGSLVSAELGDPDHELPNYVQILGSQASAGYLSVDHAPLLVPNPEKEIVNLDYAKQVNAERLAARESYRSILERTFADRGGAAAVEANQKVRQRARRLMETKLRTAFDLSQEKPATRRAYGESPFGQSCLLARRLLEHEVPAVEITLAGWDTHDDNFARTDSLCRQLDPAFSALIDDLQDCGLWQETLIVCMGEFGRTPKITATDGRGHWPRSWSLALAGGCIRTGQVLGATDPEGNNVVERPIAIADLYATIAATLHMDRDREFMVKQRPVTLIDPEGRVITELLKT